jgi:hypothetical protein
MKRSTSLPMLPWLLVMLMVGQVQAQFRYDTEYPVIGYGKIMPDNAFTDVLERINSGDLVLEYNENGSGYLDSLLAALDINPASQVMVFSKTSLKQRFITPENPRSLFFNDEVYVGFVPGSSTLEIGAMDPALGPVFFDFAQRPDAETRAEQELGRCLRCHDTYSMTGGGVPRFILSSVLAGTDGSIISHEISEITDTATPLNRRWGGWFVTGSHGSQETMGNLVISSAAMLQNLDLAANGNKADLAGLVPPGPYPRNTSDIVALLVLEHQVEVQNRLTRLNFESRTLIQEQAQLSAETLEMLTRPVLDSLFMAHEAEIGAPVSSTSGYREYFETLGPVDSRGRSLREFDLQTRTFRYPLSYLIYSPAVTGLPDQVKRYLFSQIRAELEGETAHYPQYSSDLRSVTLAILRETKPEILE